MFVLNTVFVKLINFSRAKNVPSKTSSQSWREIMTHIIRGKPAGQVVVRQSPMTIGPICVQIIYSLTEILEEILLVIFNTTVLTRLTWSRSGLGALSAQCNPTPDNRHG